MNTQTCEICFEVKPSESFRGFLCLDCKLIKDKKQKRLKDNEYKAKNREKINLKEKERRKRIKENNLNNGVRIPENKICSGCKEHKPSTDFTSDVSNLSGLSSYCKVCSNIKTKQYRTDNYEIIKKRKLEYCQNNRDKEAERAKRWREKYPERHVENNRRRSRERYHTDINYLLRQTVSKEITRGLKKRNASKNGHSCLKYLSFTIDELRRHLESQFEYWMNWSNHGPYNKVTWNDDDPSTWTWHIDHIIRHATFKYMSMDDDEFKKCWSLINLRPLNAKVNNKENFR